MPITRYEIRTLNGVPTNPYWLSQDGRFATEAGRASLREALAGHLDAANLDRLFADALTAGSTS